MLCKLYSKKYGGDIVTTKTYENENKGFVIDAFVKTFKIDPNKISATPDPHGWFNIEFEHKGEIYEIGGVVENSKEIYVYIHKNEFRKAVGKINKELARTLADKIREELGVTPEKQIKVIELETGKNIEWDGWSERDLTKKSLQEKLNALFRGNA